MTLANEITMVEGQGTSQPYVFYMAAQPVAVHPGAWAWKTARSGWATG